jgi:hypothetical protein
VQGWLRMFYRCLFAVAVASWPWPTQARHQWWLLTQCFLMLLRHDAHLCHKLLLSVSGCSDRGILAMATAARAPTAAADTMLSGAVNLFTAAS